MTAMSDYRKTVLVLRSCKADGGSHNSWKYPLTEGAVVEVPDWNEKPECGGGFHGLPFGEGDMSLLNWDMDAWWQVFEVESADLVKIDDAKVKFRRGKQVFLRQGLAPGFPLALAYIEANRPKRKPKKGDDVASGNSSSAASSGNSSRAASSGNSSSAASSGNSSSAASSGEKTMAASIGSGGMAKAGPDGCIAVGWWDEKANRPRLTVGYVGEDGIKADIWYKADANGKLTEVKP